MDEIENSLRLRRPSRVELGIRRYRRWDGWAAVRRITAITLLAAAAVLAVESVSSYVLYRHFAGLNSSFYPVGSATLDLARNVVAKIKGRHSDELIVTIDHGPLFRSDEALGYGMYPGKYRITESRYGLQHRFDLTVDDAGHRASSTMASTSPRHLYISGDSGMFGWGLNDDETVPWLLQRRFPNYDVVNLSLTSYSTVQALIELKHAEPKVTAADVVVLTYHPITNGFNVASDQMLGFLATGFEHQLGDSNLIGHMVIPFGYIDSRDRLQLAHYGVVACAHAGAAPSQCPPRQLSQEAANQVTEQAFDEILAATPAHVMVAVLSGPDSDPVVAHLRSKGVLIADLRVDKSAPDTLDVVSIDQHPGPFWHRRTAESLEAALLRARLVN
jgi:hypothetical protein